MLNSKLKVLWLFTYYFARFVIYNLFYILVKTLSASIVITFCLSVCARVHAFENLENIASIQNYKN